MKSVKFVSCADVENMRWKKKLRKLRDDISDYLMTCDYVGLKERAEIVSMIDKAMEDKT